MRYLLDSVIVIDHLNGIAAATQFLADHAGECAVSVITRAEVLAGFDDADVPLARELLDRSPRCRSQAKPRISPRDCAGACT